MSQTNDGHCFVGVVINTVWKIDFCAAPTRGNVNTESVQLLYVAYVTALKIGTCCADSVKLGYFEPVQRLPKMWEHSFCCIILNQITGR